MRVFKNKEFKVWAKSEHVTDTALKHAVSEIEGGLFEANLGGNLIKKRIVLPGRGKRGGARTILAYRTSDKAFFLYGFAKNERDNITAAEKQALKLLAHEYLSFTEKSLKKALERRELFEVSYE